MASKSKMEEIGSLTISDVNEIFEYSYKNESMSYKDIAEWVNWKFSTDFTEDDIMEISIIGCEIFEHEDEQKAKVDSENESTPY